MLDLLELAELKAELEARRMPSSEPGDVRTFPDTRTGGELVGPSASASGFVGAFITTATFAAVCIQPASYPVVIDQVELYAPAIGGTRQVALYRRPPLEPMPVVAAFPTGGVPLSATCFAGALAGPLAAPDGQMVLTPGAMQQRRELGWFIPTGQGFSIVGDAGIDLAFGIYFHEVV